MLRRLLVPAFIVMFGAFSAGGCTDNSGNGHFNPDAAAGNGGTGGGGGGAGGGSGGGTGGDSDAGGDTGGSDGGAGDGLPADAPLGG